MKHYKLTILLAAALALLQYSGTASAQNALTFEGIPVSGSIERFCLRLRHDGWRLENTRYGNECATATLTKRLGNHSVELVVTTDATRTVRAVQLRYPTMKRWNALTEEYEHLCAQYQGLYGPPLASERKEPGNTGEPGAELADGRARLRSVYEDPHGGIIAEVTPQKKHARITVTYMAAPWGYEK